ELDERGPESAERPSQRALQRRGVGGIVALGNADEQAPVTGRRLGSARSFPGFSERGYGQSREALLAVVDDQVHRSRRLAPEPSLPRPLLLHRATAQPLQRDAAADRGLGVTAVSISQAAPKRPRA